MKKIIVPPILIEPTIEYLYVEPTKVKCRRGSTPLRKKKRKRK